MREHPSPPTSPWWTRRTGARIGHTPPAAGGPRHAVAVSAWWAACALVVATLALPASAQQLLDRVVARVGPTAITLLDVEAARGIGVVRTPPGDDARRAAVEQLIERQLALQEVARFPPPEPDPAAVAQQVERYKSFAGGQLDELMRSTGLDEDRLRDMARDTLRIDAYVAQRFGTTVQVSDAEAQEYFRAHPDEFMRNGARLTFEEAAPAARERAADERRRATVARWLKDLRARAEVVEL